MGDRRGFEQSVTVSSGERGEDTLDDVSQLLAPSKTVSSAVEALVSDKIGSTKHLGGEPFPFAFVLHGEHDLRAIPAREGAVRGDGRVRGSGASGSCTTVTREIERVAHPLDESIEKAGLQWSALAYSFAIGQRSDDSRICVHASKIGRAHV